MCKRNQGNNTCAARRGKEDGRRPGAGDAGQQQGRVNLAPWFHLFI
jgi:hypothetical protein